MAASETITAQVTCDHKAGKENACCNTVIIRNGGVQRVLRHARDSFDWAVIDGKNYCPNHSIAALRESLALKEKK